jgi:ABC-type uncharacterized transport system involved in gliding motility auxiliary subunit
MASRQSKFASYTAIYGAVVVAILVIVNMLADRYNKSYDTTANKRYSLSEQTEKILKNLKGDVKAYYFDRPSRFETMRGLLDRYSNVSSKFQVEYVDLEKEPQKAIALGARRPGTLILDNGAKKEEAKAVTEQEITGAMVRMQQAADQTICALDGHGERRLDGADERSFSAVKLALERNNYKTQTVKVLEKAEIPANCTMLLAAGPTREYNESAIEAIKKFVEGGGDALFLLTPALKSPGDETDNDPKLNALLAGWNIEVENNLLFGPEGRPTIVGEEYAQHPIVRETRMPAYFALVRSLNAKTGAEKLISSSSDVIGTKTLDVAKLQSGMPPADFKGPLVVAAATTIGGGSDQKKQGRVVVMGSVDWASTALLGRYGNRDLFLNTVNWLSADEDLISIRPKEPEDRRLSAKPSQFWMLYVTCILPTLGVLAGGIFIWLKRR